jgi:hypothetical protein
VAAGAVVAIGPEREQRRRCDDAAHLLSIRREARVSPRRAVRRLAIDHVPAPDELRAPVRPSSSGDCCLMGATRSTAATGRATGGGVAPVAIYAGSGSRSGRRPRPRCRVGRPAGLRAGASKWSSCVGTALHREQRDLTSGRRPGRSRSRAGLSRASTAALHRRQPEFEPLAPAPPLRAETEQPPSCPGTEIMWPSWRRPSQLHRASQPEMT